MIVNSVVYLEDIRLLHFEQWSATSYVRGHKTMKSLIPCTKRCFVIYQESPILDSPCFPQTPINQN